MAKIRGSDKGTLLKGTELDDFIQGFDGSDTIVGNSGDDRMEGGKDADLLNGGSGRDTADYAGSDAGVAVSLRTGKAGGGHAAGDRLVSIENLRGSLFADRLEGDSWANVLTGDWGRDHLIGGGGNDTLMGGRDADTLDGGSGFDIASYEGGYFGATVSLATGRGTGQANFSSGDVLINIEGLRGSASNDHFYGSARGDWMDGGGEADLLSGAGGNDTLLGGSGGDTIDGGTGRDLINGGTGLDFVSYSSSTKGVFVALGNDLSSEGDRLVSIEGVIGSKYADVFYGDDEAANIYNGSYGVDMVTYARSTRSVVVDLSAWGNDRGDARGDEFTSIERIVGTGYGDRLVGDERANTFDGGAGDDVLRGGYGADTLIGGAGFDTADYSRSTSSVSVDLTKGVGTWREGEAYGDVLSGIESIIGSRFGDTLVGAAFAERLSGEAENDTILGSAGADTLVGGTGSDVLSYEGSLAGVAISLMSGVGKGGYAEGDRVSGFEHAVGSIYADRITGDAAANRIEGGNGSDTLAGAGGVDSLWGGGGFDYIDYSTSKAGVTVGLNGKAGVGGDAAGDRISGVEGIIGSANADRLTAGYAAASFQGGAGNDTLIGGDYVDTLQGGDGNDVLAGGHAADRLDGGAGFDTVSYAAAVDWEDLKIDLSTGVGHHGEAQGDVLVGIEAVIAAGGNDTLIGSSADNLLSGGAGDDSLVGGAGADTLNGGSGHDVASYEDSTAGVVVRLDGGANAGGFALGDVLIRIEGLIGSDYDDRLIGGSGADTLDGGDGNDTVVGGLGGDVLRGGDGVDVLDYSGAAAGIRLYLNADGTSGEADGDWTDGFEVLIGTRFADTLTAYKDGALVRAGDGNDTVTIFANVTAYGGAGNDTIVINDVNTLAYGGDGIDTITVATYYEAVDLSLATGTDAIGGSRFSGFENARGGASNDRIAGNGAANRIEGRAGDDMLSGAGGADTLIGGDGADTFRFAAASDSSGAAVDSIADMTADDWIEISFDADTTIAGTQVFTFIGEAEFSAAGQLRWSNGHLTGNIDGDLASVDFDVEVTTALSAAEIGPHLIL